MSAERNYFRAGAPEGSCFSSRMVRPLDAFAEAGACEVPACGGDECTAGAPLRATHASWANSPVCRHLRRQEERRIDWRRVQVDAEMQMCAGHATRRADTADRRAGVDERADRGLDCGQVAVQGQQALTVVDDHG